MAVVLIIASRRYGAPEDDRPAAPGTPLLERRPITLGLGIHLLGGLAPAAAYVIETSDGLVLIDTGLDRDASHLKQQMTSLGLDWRRVRAILLTHVHGDHSGGAQHLRTATGAKVYAGKGDAAVLRAGQPREAFFSTFLMPAEVSPVPTSVDVELNDEQVITVGEVRFRALATPGHTPGSMCYLMERDGQNVLFSGDVILALSPRPESLGTRAAHLAPRYGGDATAFLATFHRLKALPVPELLLPGHPRLDLAPRSPRLPPSDWESLLDLGIRELEPLQARYAQDGANFLDSIPKKLLVDLYYLGDFKDVAVYGFFASSRFFLVDAPGGPGLYAFVQDRLRRLGRTPVAPTAVLLTSGNPEETAGLAEVVAQSRCQVVASPEAWPAIKAACPAWTSVLAAEDLTQKDWFKVVPIPLHGRGVAPVAYLLPWGQKSVLFSGRIPVKPSPSAAEGMMRDLSQARVSVSDYLASLQRLGDLKPDLWLPAFPAEGQNACLYDREWQEILAQNEQRLR
jgi:glyoxylase-like metal-dependent hydrolase (beta-lactamase superfamily II)